MKEQTDLLWMVTELNDEGEPVLFNMEEMLNGTE